VEDAHVLVDSAADELVVALLEVCLLLCSSLPVQDGGPVRREAGLADVLPVFGDWLDLCFYFFLLEIDAFPFVGESVVAVLLAAVELVAGEYCTGSGE
jgi:hypothetical protein